VAASVAAVARVQVVPQWKRPEESAELKILKAKFKASRAFPCCLPGPLL
jgi:hypothetical protein